ncbi:hypothetical protein HK099_001658 [Clydaea vesicula]|uniref:C2H2-type domain-containing protein n=1 Tax=Clydaea vesicula TaxID=447962 RepID=A0AAD5XVW0_9FUNG|nr:hypothetical protein HK099_001658 [Clydaea vesicula]
MITSVENEFSVKTLEQNYNLANYQNYNQNDNFKSTQIKKGSELLNITSTNPTMNENQNIVDITTEFLLNQFLSSPQTGLTDTWTGINESALQQTNQRDPLYATLNKPLPVNFKPVQEAQTMKEQNVLFSPPKSLLNQPSKSCVGFTQIRQSVNSSPATNLINSPCQQVSPYFSTPTQQQQGFESLARSPQFPIDPRMRRNSVNMSVNNLVHNFNQNLQVRTPQQNLLLSPVRPLIVNGSSPLIGTAGNLFSPPQQPLYSPFIQYMNTPEIFAIPSPSPFLQALSSPNFNVNTNGGVGGINVEEDSLQGLFDFIMEDNTDDTSGVDILKDFQNESHHKNSFDANSFGIDFNPSNNITYNSEISDISNLNTCLQQKQKKPSKVKVKAPKNSNNYTTARSSMPPPIKMENAPGPDGVIREVLYACPHADCKDGNGKYIKTFTRPYNLKSHYKSAHTLERPYECEECGQTFVRKHDLKRHSNLHQGERPFKCPVCFKSFARADALTRHRKSVEGKMSLCDIKYDGKESDDCNIDLGQFFFNENPNVGLEFNQGGEFELEELFNVKQEFEVV